MTMDLSQMLIAAGEQIRAYQTVAAECDILRSERAQAVADRDQAVLGRDQALREGEAHRISIRELMVKNSNLFSTLDEYRVAAEKLSMGLSVSVWEHPALMVTEVLNIFRLKDVAPVRSLAQWAKDFHEVAVSKGFWDAYKTRPERIASIPEKLCLIHSEVSEALEDYRKGLDPTARTYEGKKLCGFGSELADIVIRTLELAEALGIDIGAIIAEKHEYNKTRSRMNGGKVC
jgi:hypothetical protein